VRDSFITLYSTARSHIQCWQSTTLLDIFTYLALIVPRLLWNCRDARSFSPSANFINIGCRIRYYYLKSITAYLLSLHLFHHHWFSWNNIKCYWGLFSSSFSVRYLFILGKHLIEENSSWIMFLLFSVLSMIFHKYILFIFMWTTLKVTIQSCVSLLQIRHSSLFMIHLFIIIWYMME